MTSYTLREATVADANQITHHRAQMFTDIGKATPESIAAMAAVYPAWIQDQFAKDSYKGWFAQAPDGTTIGGAGVWLHSHVPNPSDPSPQIAHVIDVYVAPDFRRQGIARALMDTVVDWCAAAGYRVVTLNASNAGRPLYETLGFTSTNFMQKNIPPRDEGATTV